MFKIIIYFFILIIFTSSCADTFSSVKRGLTGAKGNSADEFLVKKKDPLILPPDFENLPTPDENVSEIEESLFEDTMNSASTEGETTEEKSKASSAESSILRKIQSK